MRLFENLFSNPANRTINQPWLKWWRPTRYQFQDFRAEMMEDFHKKTSYKLGRRGPKWWSDGRILPESSQSKPIRLLFHQCWGIFGLLLPFSTPMIYLDSLKSQVWTRNFLLLATRTTWRLPPKSCVFDFAGFNKWLNVQPLLTNISIVVRCIHYSTIYLYIYIEFSLHNVAYVHMSQTPTLCWQTSESPVFGGLLLEKTIQGCD
jgi:hypothetical protein